MKKNILLFIAISIFGCSSDGESKPTPNPTTLKLVKEIETDLVTNKTETQNYIYTGDVLTQIELIESKGDTYKTEFIYTNNILEKLLYFKNGVSEGTNVFTYQNGLIFQSVSRENNIDFTHTYIYNNVNQLSVDQQVSFGKIDSQESRVYGNTASNGMNTTTVTYTDSKNVIQEKFVYESDFENSPYLGVYPAPYSKLLFPLAVQNVSKKTNKSGGVYTYEYIYENHKPIQAIEKYNGVSQTKTTYTYE